MPTGYFQRSTEIGQLSQTNPKKCKRKILDALWANAGNVAFTARSLGISREFFWNLLRKHGMSTVPVEVRKEFRERFKVYGRSRKEKS